MVYFKDEQEVYDTIGRLFLELRDDPELFPRFQEANTVVQYRFSEPDSQITVRMMQDQPGHVDLGPTELEPEVTMTMTADTAHRFWLGQLNITLALARGQIRSHGPVAKVLRLVPLVKPVFPRYRTQLEEQGRQDLMTED